jgi:Ion channel
MTDSAGHEPGAGRAASPRPRVLLLALVRSAASTAVLVAIYYLLPLTRPRVWASLTMLIIGLAVFTGLLTFQVRTIVRSPFPGVRALEALATSLPLFLLMFAATYTVLSTASPGDFSQSLTRSDALYFTVTVFATVGFGDITPTTEMTRLLVTGQMLADLIVIGLGARVVVGAVTRSRQRRPGGTGAIPPGG